MIRLRFVQEYRGQRIVTNGKLYGVEGELVTDCRYLDVEGARAAIDSELGIAARRKDIEWQRRQAAEYISREGRDQTFGCDCGWRGSYDQLTKTGAEVTFVRCPACSSDAVFMTFGDPPEEPTARRAKSAGKKKAVEEKSNKEPSAGATRTLASQLPPLDGTELRLVWGLERNGDDNYLVVTYGQARVRSERASSGDPMRFYEVKRALKKKYRARFVSLTATATAAKRMLGHGARSRLTPT